MSVVSVVGGGPAGLQTASLLAEEGFDVSVFEEHNTVGRPVQCAGLVSKSGVEELGLKLGECTVNEVKGAKIFSPGGECITVQRSATVALVIDRFAFDQLFYRKAKKAGCDIRLGSRLIDLRNGKLFLESKGHGEMLGSKIIVGADGANSVVRNSTFGSLAEKNFIQGYQVRAEGSFDRDMVELHFGFFAPGFFAWVIPESEKTARIGLGARLGENAAGQLEKFLQQRNLQVKVLGKSGALIPLAAPAKRLVDGNTLLVGDAAMQTKATTGGGIVFGLKAAGHCAEAIANNLKHQQSLRAYEKNIGQLNRELLLHWRIYSYIHSLQAGQFDRLFIKARDAGIERFLEQYGDMDKPSAFMRKILFKPKMWGLLPAALKMV